MALLPKALTLVDTVATRLVGPDVTLSAEEVAKIELLIHSVSDAIASIAGRPLHYEERTLTLPHRGGPFLDLTVAPIVSVSELLVVDEEGVLDAYASTEYGVDLAGGWLWKSSEWAPSEVPRYRMTFIGGYVTDRVAELDAAEATPLGLTRDLPYTLEQACIQGVAALWHRSGNPLISSDSTTDKSVAYRTLLGALPPEVVDTALAYRRRA